MTRRRLAVGFVAALSLGLTVGLLAGEPRQISVDVWLAATSAWLGWVVVRELVAAAPVRPDRLRGIWRRTRSDDGPDPRPRSLVTLEGLVVNAAHSDRAATIRLRPRLIELAEELLRTRHGIAARSDPDQVGEVLGDLAWIVDREVELARVPTLTEVEALVDRLMRTGERPVPMSDGTGIGARPERVAR